MPRASKPEPPSRLTTRRSSRLNNRQQGIKNNAIVEIEERPKVKRRRLVNTNPSLLEMSTTCVDEMPPGKMHISNDTRRSQRITPTELARRERALMKKEQELKRKGDELDERLLSLSKKEDEASLIVSQMEERKAKATLTQLEEHFTCALCYEIMAHPYTLNPGQCGHTFCALCILKWFFSRLHKACGGWHESVDCPICRSLLVITPDRVPRLDITFPFVPNRTASAVVQDLIDKLARVPSSGSSLTVKEEEGEVTWESGSAMEWGIKKGKTKEEEETEEASDVAGWKEGGGTRAEWLKKDREGRREMSHLTTHWTTLRSNDFIALKQKFGV